MSGWIKMYKRLRNQAEVLRLRNILGLSRRDVLGALALLWFVADEQADNRGFIRSGTEAMVDEETGTSGMAKALQDKDVDWLRVTKNGIILPRFAKYNDSEKKRTQTQRRVAKFRSGNALQHGRVTQPEQSRAEQHREEKKRRAAEQPTAAFATDAAAAPDAAAEVSESPFAAALKARKRGDEAPAPRSAYAPPDPLRRALSLAGFRGNSLDRLATVPQLTPAWVDAKAAEARADPSIRSRTGWLIRAIESEFGPLEPAG